MPKKTLGVCNSIRYVLLIEKVGVWSLVVVDEGYALGSSKSRLRRRFGLSWGRSLELSNRQLFFLRRDAETVRIQCELHYVSHLNYM